jgi:WD40 repeat protein
MRRRECIQRGLRYSVRVVREKRMNRKTVARLFLLTVLLILPLASCRGGETPPIPQMPTGTYSETRLPLLSPTPVTPSTTHSTTPSPAPTLTTTSTASKALPTFSYPITPGPVINRENAGRLALLGAVNAKATSKESRLRHQLDWSPDGQKIVLASNGDGIRFIDPLNMKDIGGITEISGMAINFPGTVVYNPDGKTIATTMPAGLANEPSPIYFIDTETHKENHKMVNESWTLMIAYNHAGNRMAVGSRFKVTVYDFTIDKWIWQGGDEGNELFDFASFSWDDRYLAFTGEYGGGIVNTNTWDFVKSIDEIMFEYLCFSRDNKYFSIPPGIWSLDDFTLVKPFSEDFSFDICEYGKENDIVIGLINQTKIQIWDVEKGELLTVITGQQGRICDMVLSPDGRFIATAEGFENPMVKIWGIPA